MRIIYPSAPFVRVRNSRCAVYYIRYGFAKKNDSTLVRSYNVCSLSHAIVFAMKTRWYNGQTGLNTRWKLILWIFHKTRAVVFCDLFMTCRLWRRTFCKNKNWRLNWLPNICGQLLRGKEKRVRKTSISVASSIFFNRRVKVIAVINSLRLCGDQKCFYKSFSHRSN